MTDPQLNPKRVELPGFACHKVREDFYFFHLDQYQTFEHCQGVIYRCIHRGISIRRLIRLFFPDRNKHLKPGDPQMAQQINSRRQQRLNQIEDKIDSLCKILFRMLFG